MRQDLTNSPLLSRGYLFETRHLTCTYCTRPLWCVQREGKKKKNMKKRGKKGWKNYVCILGNPSHTHKHDTLSTSPILGNHSPLEAVFVSFTSTFYFFLSIMSRLSLTCNLGVTDCVTTVLAVPENPHI